MAFIWRSGPAAQPLAMLRIALALVGCLALGPAMAQDEPKRPPEQRRADEAKKDEAKKDEPRKEDWKANGRVCLNAAETRDAVVQHKLVPAASAQNAAANHASAESLRSRLCRWNDDYIYEVTLLRRDGKVLHVFVRGANGSVVARDERL